MNLFQILAALYTKDTSDWILDVDEKNINIFYIQRMLALNPQTMDYARFLNQFVYTLPPKMYLAAAWSILFFNGKKLSKAPFIKSIKKNESKEKYHYIYDKFRKQYSLSNRDMQVAIPFLEKAIGKDKISWFSYYGITKEIWVWNDINVELMKLYNPNKL